MKMKNLIYLIQITGIICMGVLAGIYEKKIFLLMIPLIIGICGAVIWFLKKRAENGEN